MGRASDSAKLMAIGLMNFADDKGYFHHDAVLIRNAVRPFDEDCVNTHGALHELAKMGYFEVREHPKHGKIAFIESFVKHQVINRPSKHSLKELWDSCTIPGALTESSRNTHPGKERKGTGKGMEGKGREEIVAVVDSSPLAEDEMPDFSTAPTLPESPAEPTPAPEPKPKTPKADNRKGSLEELRAYAVEQGLPAADGEFMFANWEANGWTRNNKPLKDWKKSMVAWKAGGYMPSQKARGGSGAPRPPAQFKGIQEDIGIPTHTHQPPQQ